MTAKSICLVGLGSIGMTHLKHISKSFEHIIIVDKNKEAILKVGESFKQNKIDFFTEITSLREYKKLNHAVISNWGPDHFETFNYLQSIGIKNYIIEKPITDSVKELYRLKECRNRNNLRIFINFQWSHSALVKNLENTTKRLKLGRLVGINISGGAKCIATNGIHYLDLANYLFSDSPIEVFSNLYNSEINPRNSKFLFLGGIATWKYSYNRYLNISFSNESRLSPTMEMVYEFGNGTIQGDSLVFKKISEKNLKKFKSKTKTFYPPKKSYNYRAFTFPDGSDGQILIYKKFTNYKAFNDNFEHSFNSSLDFFAALVSNRKGKKLSLPLKLSKLSREYNFKWEIS